MTKKNLQNSIYAIAICIAVIWWAPIMVASCSSVGAPETAVEQIYKETKDPMALAKAAYLDALVTFNDLAERYVKYMPYMLLNHPDRHEQIMGYFKDMDDMLTMWQGFSQLGVLPENATTNFETYANGIITILMAIDGEIK